MWALGLTEIQLRGIEIAGLHNPAALPREFSLFENMKQSETSGFGVDLKSLWIFRRWNLIAVRALSSVELTEALISVEF